MFLTKKEYATFKRLETALDKQRADRNELNYNAKYRSADLAKEILGYSPY